MLTSLPVRPIGTVLRIAGLVPISNFVKRTPKPLVDQINRVDGKRVVAVKANAAPGVNAFAKTMQIKAWLKTQQLDPSVAVNPSKWS